MDTSVKSIDVMDTNANEVNAVDTSTFMSLSRGESHWLNVLRGIAIIFVIYGHAQQIFINPYWFPHYPGPDRSIPWLMYSYIASFGLMMFFSMSGCLIYHSSMRNIRQFGYFSKKEYVLARIIRLYPPLLLSVAVLILVYFALDWLGYHSKEDFTTGDEIYVARHTLAIDWSNIGSALVFLNTLAPGYQSPMLNGPLWSLAHEFWFYVFGLFFIWLGVRSKIAALVLLLAVSMYSYQSHEFWFYGLMVWLVSFVMTHLEYGVNQRVSTVVAILGSLTFLGVWGWFIYNHTNSWYEYRHYYVAGIAFSFMMPLILRFFRNRPFEPGRLSRGTVFVSHFSYTLYLIHFPLFIFIFVVTNLLVTSWVERMAIVIASILACGWFAWYAAKHVENKQFMKAFVKRWL